jgi:hypothetical protein
MNLLDEWAAWQPGRAPFVLEADLAKLTAGGGAGSLALYDNWAAFHCAPDFGAAGDSRLHVGLLPHPFCGDLRRASIYILMLNPGLGATDYFGEYEMPAYRNALLAMLRQDFPLGGTTFLYLDPQYAWHGGFAWWHGKLAAVVGQLAKEWAVPFAEARARLGQKIASIELLPYHSASFRDSGGWLRELHSVALARAFVHEVVVPRVERGEAVAIVTRQAAVWNLPDHPGVIRYSGYEARAAHLSPGSPGGKAILDQMRRCAGAE